MCLHYNIVSTKMCFFDDPTEHLVKIIIISLSTLFSTRNYRLHILDLHILFSNKNIFSMIKKNVGIHSQNVLKH